MPPEPIDRFEELFRGWAGRPPATPADEAARRVLLRLPAVPEPRPLLSPRHLAATAATVLAVVLATYVHVHDHETQVVPVAEDTTLGLVEAPVVPDGVALILLDSGTPLYLTLSPPMTPEGDPPS